MANRANHDEERADQGHERVGSGTVDELAFWRSCCERGVTLCQVPKPMREQTVAWLAEKHPTFVDRPSWSSAYPFYTLDEAFRRIEPYFSTGEEPRADNR